MKIHLSHASPAVDVLVGTCRFSWRLGPRRLPLPTVFARFCAAARSVDFHQRRDIGLTAIQDTSTSSRRPFMTQTSWMSTPKTTCTLPVSSSSIQFVSLAGVLCTSQADRTRCIQVKTASLRWHSPMLDDISAVRHWSPRSPHKGC